MPLKGYRILAREHWGYDAYLELYECSVCRAAVPDWCAWRFAELPFSFWTQLFSFWKQRFWCACAFRRAASMIAFYSTLGSGRI